MASRSRWLRLPLSSVRVDAQAAVPAALELATTRAALSFVSSAGVSLARAWSISIPVTNLAEGVLQTMIWNQVRAHCRVALAGEARSRPEWSSAQRSLAADRVEAEKRRRHRKSSSRAGSRSVPSRSRARKPPVAAEEPKQSINPDLAFEINETTRAFDHMLSRLRDPSVEDIDRLSNWSSFVLEAETGARGRRWKTDRGRADGPPRPDEEAP